MKLYSRNKRFVCFSLSLALDRYDSAHKFVIYASSVCIQTLFFGPEGSSFCSLLLLVSTLKLHTPTRLSLPSFPLPWLAVINAPLELTTRFQLHLVNATMPRLCLPLFLFATPLPLLLLSSFCSFFTHIHPQFFIQKKCHFMHFKCVAVCALSHIMYLYLSPSVVVFVSSLYVCLFVSVYLRLCLGVPHIVCQCT